MSETDKVYQHLKNEVEYLKKRNSELSNKVSAYQKAFNKVSKAMRKFNKN